jgi:hypothetical protein
VTNKRSQDIIEWEIFRSIDHRSNSNFRLDLRNLFGICYGMRRNLKKYDFNDDRSNIYHDFNAD